MKKFYWLLIVFMLFPCAINFAQDGAEIGDPVSDNADVSDDPGAEDMDVPDEPADPEPGTAEGKPGDVKKDPGSFGPDEDEPRPEKEEIDNLEKTPGQLKAFSDNELTDRKKTLDEQLKLVVGEIEGRKAPKHWIFKENFDLSFMDGNTEGFVVEEKMLIAWDNLDNLKASLKTTWKFVRQNDQNMENEGFATLKGEYVLSSRFSPYLYTKHGWQESLKVTYHAEVGLGMSLLIIQLPEDNAEYKENPICRHVLSVAGVFEHQDYADSAALEAKDAMRLAVVYHCERYLWADFMITADFEYKTSLDDFDDWSLNFVFSVDWVYDANTRVKFSYEFAETSIVPAGVKRVDHLLKIGIELLFKW